MTNAKYKKKWTNYFFVILWLTIAITAIASISWQVPNNITKYDSIFESNNVKYGLDPILLKVQIAAESRFINATTANEAGAVEIAQFTQIAAEKSRWNGPSNVHRSEMYRHDMWLI